MGEAGGRIRAFVGVPLEPQARAGVGQLLERLRRRCERAGWRANWVPPANLHLTLEFLGWVETGRVDAIAAALAPLSAHPPFEMHLSGLGAFPPRGRPRVLWLGVREGAEALEAIAAEVEDRLEDLGFPPEQRPFHPHLTLARVKTAPRDARDVVHALADAEGGTSTVREVVLYQSRLRREGPEYTPMARALLVGE
ncbi:MAG: RNA 2',3'-cyclic phosphodiesterase [Myxococcota bacterium]